jgi:two-component system, OmpR family, response regulator RegX3
MHIGILEDDAQQRELLQLWLDSAQHGYHSSATAAEFYDSFQKQAYDALLVDWMLPDGTGADVIRWVRDRHGWALPIVVVTSRDDEATVVSALKSGADDYLVKPPKPMELLARLEAVARRSKALHGSSVMKLGAYEIDLSAHQLTFHGKALSLTQKEFDLSTYFFQNPGKLLSRDHLLNKIWGFNVDVDTRTVDTHVSRLRKKLTLDGTNGWQLSPVYGFGYRFDRTEG